MFSRAKSFALATLILLSAFVSSANADLTDDTLADYRRADVQEPPEPGAVLFVGSSTIHRWARGGAITRSFPGIRVLDRGVPGTSYRFLLAHVDDLVLRYQPSRVVVYSGDNDVSEGRSPSRIARHAAAFFDSIHDRLSEIEIVAVSVKPSPHLAARHLLDEARETNERIAALTRSRPWLAFVDIYESMIRPDGGTRRELFDSGGLHLSPLGYAILTDALRPYVVR